MGSRSLLWLKLWVMRLNNSGILKRIHLLATLHSFDRDIDAVHIADLCLIHPATRLHAFAIKRKKDFLLSSKRLFGAECSNDSRYQG